MFTLSEVVPWGRSFDEYGRMFALSAADLEGRVLGCGDGPASFNAEAAARGHRVVSCDPLYQFDAVEIRTRIAETTPIVLEQTRRNAERFVWSSPRSIDELAEWRQSAMARFLDDYANGANGRYVAAALPDLPFARGTFDLALCSHFLFLYSAQHSEQFHIAALRELLRVAREIRVFPLLDLNAALSAHLGPATDVLRTDGYTVTIERVPYEFQRGGHEMLRVFR
ncbi:MAG: SAM-dependent methyltransferase [Vicinamibacterales bacterium]